MRKRILCLILVIATVLSSLCVNVSASTSLSEDSAKKFLRFLSGSLVYTPKSDNAFYQLLTGKTDNLIIKSTFLDLVYKTIDENLYEKRLNAIRDSLLDYADKELSKSLWDLAQDVAIDEIGDAAGLPTVDLNDYTAVVECVVGLFDVRNSNRAKYFNAMLGIDPDDEFFDIISGANATSYSISQSDKKLLDEWARYVRSIDNIKSSTTNNIQILSPNTGGSSNYSCKITFDSNCNDVSDYSYTYYSNQDNWHVPTITRPGYIFCGWYYDSACTQSTTGTVTLDSDKIFYAKWIKRELKITLNSNCSYVANKTITADLLDSSNTTIPNMERNGYIFLGWYLDKSCTNKMPSTMTISTDLNLYAKWQQQYGYSVSNGTATITDLLCFQVVSDQTITDLILPSSIDDYIVTHIKSFAFSSNKQITSVSLPDTITDIGENAFSYCDALENITIGKKVSSIGRYAFWQNHNLKSINVSKDNQLFCSQNGVLFNKDKTTLIAYPNGKEGRYEIPNSVKELGLESFRSCKGLTSITIPNSVEIIGNLAFESCNGLSEITIPQSVQEIGDSAFEYCTNLTNVTISSGVKFIGKEAFNSCKRIEKIIIPDSVVEIDESAFSDCENLKQITLSNNLETIGSHAFVNCISLNNVIIPNSVTTLGADLFCCCTSLNNVVLSDNITSIPVGLFERCISLTKVRIPDKVETIELGAFFGCSNLTEIILPKSLRTIDDWTFEGCKNINNIYYTGSSKEWKKIQYNDYEGLRVKIFYNYDRVDSPSVEITKIDDNIYVESNNISASADVKIYLAVYNSSGKLLQTKTSNFDENIVFTDVISGTIYKVFMWEDAEPLCAYAEAGKIIL